MEGKKARFQSIKAYLISQPSGQNNYSFRIDTAGLERAAFMK